jgi:hypothetical protein
MHIGTGIHIISQRQLKGWAGRKNHFKIIIGEFLAPAKILNVRFEKKQSLWSQKMCAIF